MSVSTSGRRVRLRVWARLRWLAPVAVLLALIPPPPGGVVPAYARAQGPLLAGVHAPNRAWRETDYEQIASGRFGVVKMMSYHPLESYARLRQVDPGVQFVVRLDTPWNELPPPERFAAAQVAYLRALVDAGYQPWVEIGNEPNLELHPNAEAVFAAWYGQVLDLLRAVVPEAKYGFPGLAQDRREDVWLAAAAGEIERSDWLGVHAYWHNAREMLDPQHGLRLVHVHRQFPHLPLLVTEAGNEAVAHSQQRADEYAQFTRTLARLPYVRSVDFFILSGTPEWQRFFFDDRMTAAVRDATRDPVPVLDGLGGARQTVAAAVEPLLAAGRPGVPSEALVARPAPEVLVPEPVPPPFARRRLLADPAPSPTVSPSAQAGAGRWLALPSAQAAEANEVDTPLEADGAPSQPSALRTASTYLGTDFSARLDLPAPRAGLPEAVQLAEEDLFRDDDKRQTPSGIGVSRTGFALLWDGAQWRLQYRREGTLAVDQPLQAVPGGASWYQVELALERRSAAAWIWRRGDLQPPQPSAVFAPPAEAALDGARPRALFIPGGPVENVVLEGGTRD